MSAGAIFTIVFFLMTLMAMAVAVLILWLNKIGLISIYIPQKFRVYLLKDYMTDEEIEIYGQGAILDDRVKNIKELSLRQNLQPGKFGHKIEDSFFSDHCDSSNYDEDELDPNKGLKSNVEIPTIVKRNKNLPGIDDSPPNSSAH